MKRRGRGWRPRVAAVVLLLTCALLAGCAAVGEVPAAAPVDTSPRTTAPSSVVDPTTGSTGETEPSASPAPTTSSTSTTTVTTPTPPAVEPSSGTAADRTPALETAQLDTPVPDAGAIRDVGVTVSSNPVAAGAVVDADVAAGRAGQSWTAAPGDAAPFVRLTWVAPQTVSSVLVLGLVQNVYAPEHSTGAPLNATLTFDDGSTVAVDGISGVEAEATVVGFAPRTTASVTITLRKTLVRAAVGLREVAFFGPGSTPPRWSDSTGPTYSAVPAPATCPSVIPAATATTALQLVCPASGSAVDGSAVVVVRARSGVGSTVQARAWRATSATAGAIDVVASAVVGTDGTARLTFPTTGLAQGPIGVQIRFAGAAGSGLPTVSLQLYNRTGVPLDTSSHAPAGMTLAWSEDFTSGLAVTGTGHGAVYGAAKNERWGSSEFGSAIFADPASGAGTLATVGSDYLRIRAQSTNGRVDPNNWGRQHESGLLSSMRQGGSGFAAQYGYFEARMLAPGGIGTWPAFWMMDTSSATSAQQLATEVDAVELYGHNTVGSCQTVHNWNGANPTNPLRCADGMTDWSMVWHTYGVRIIPGGADFYIDGQLVHSARGVQGTDRPFFFMLNLSLGGGWPIDLSPTNQTADLYVDWVRVYT